VTAVRKTSRVRRDPDDHTRLEPTAAVDARGPVRLDQLQAELARSAKLDEVALSAEGDPAQASAEAPVTIWTLDRVSTDQLLAAVKAHEPDPAWAPDGEVEQADLDGAKAKVVAGEPLTPAEVTVLFRHLLGS
jgi:hypothetical protein